MRGRRPPFLRGLALPQEEPATFQTPTFVGSIRQRGGITAAQVTPTLGMMHTPSFQQNIGRLLVTNTAKAMPAQSYTASSLVGDDSG